MHSTTNKDKNCNMYFFFFFIWNIEFGENKSLQHFIFSILIHHNTLYIDLVDIMEYLLTLLPTKLSIFILQLLWHLSIYWIFLHLLILINVFCISIWRSRNAMRMEWILKQQLMTKIHQICLLVICQKKRKKRKIKMESSAISLLEACFSV